MHRKNEILRKKNENLQRVLDKQAAVRIRSWFLQYHHLFHNLDANSYHKYLYKCFQSSATHFFNVIKILFRCAFFNWHTCWLLTFPPTNEGCFPITNSSSHDALWGEALRAGRNYARSSKSSKMTSVSLMSNQRGGRNRKSYVFPFVQSGGRREALKSEVLRSDLSIRSQQQQLYRQRTLGESRRRNLFIVCFSDIPGVWNFLLSS